MSERVSSASFPWIEIRRGYYRQQLDSLSTRWSTWYTDDLEWRRDPVNIASYCKIRCPKLSPLELETRLRKAWIALRYHSPGIASGLVREPEGETHYRSYETPTRSALSQWVWQTFRVHTHKSIDVLCEELGREFMPVLNFCPGRPEEATAGSSGELLLVCNHFFNDGRGTFYLWQAFLKLAQIPEEVVFGDEAEHLPPSRDDLLGLPPRPTVPAFIRAATAIGNAFTPKPIALPLEVNADTSKPGSKMVRHMLTEQQTAALVLACRKRGITVTAAFRAAHMMSCQAAWTASGREPRDQYMAIEMFDVRPWFRKPYDSRRNFGADYHGLIPARFDLSIPNSFDRLAQDVNEWLRERRQEYAADPNGLDAILVVMQSLLGGPTPDSVSPAAPIFGSYGVIDGKLMQRQYGDEIYVEDVWSGVPCAGGSMSGSWIWTFNGQLNILFSYDTACYSTAMFDNLIQDTARRLLQGMGID